MEWKLKTMKKLAFKEKSLKFNNSIISSRKIQTLSKEISYLPPICQIFVS